MSEDPVKYGNEPLQAGANMTDDELVNTVEWLSGGMGSSDKDVLRELCRRLKKKEESKNLVIGRFANAMKQWEKAERRLGFLQTASDEVLTSMDNWSNACIDRVMSESSDFEWKGAAEKLSQNAELNRGGTEL